MRIALVTDAWHPQVNGVVRALSTTIRELERQGHAVTVIAPDGFRTVPCPSYPEIRLSVAPYRAVARRLDSFAPEAVHIATEGPLGWAARRHCRRRGWPFTTSFHTRFPEYVHARTRLPLRAGYGLLRRFHAPAARVMVTTETLRRELADLGLHRTAIWTRGVDTTLFGRQAPAELDLPRPVFAYVGRVAVEKNLRAFLDLDLPGSKLVVGDGPQRPALEAEYPDARFVGAKHGPELAAHHAAADVFVFPSTTDTFGLVLLEALASGVPVAAYPVTGPTDVLGDSGAGVLRDDLRAAALDALNIPPQVCRAHAERFAWPATAREFVANLEPIATGAPAAAA
ncbi:hypothetical protein SAMN05216241_10970 [Limimonas halophila]|uniref:Glycosyltransferase subfamily 4-like N-terminal domain-containing protein n=1 Tax=Limimonas halophila TaxID=1082479 RepID=A0A1G7TGM1_9PROT|nr:glycosyltransferase family 1 protein [Limimonas halophila]SDG34164.1 hypothetical protein SAMN05216241_10970 [Limimonas halophila]